MLDGQSYSILSHYSFTGTSMRSNEDTLFFLKVQNGSLLEFVQLKFVLLGELFAGENAVEIRQVRFVFDCPLVLFVRFLLCFVSWGELVLQTLLRLLCIWGFFYLLLFFLFLLLFLFVSPNDLFLVFLGLA